MSRTSRIEDIVTRVRKFGFRETLGKINRIAAELHNEPGRAKEVKRFRTVGKTGLYKVPQTQVMSTHGLATLAKIVLAHGNQWKSNTPNGQDLVLLHSHVANLPTRFGVEPLGTVTVKELFFQASYQQFPFQFANEWADIGRTLVLYTKIPKILKKEGFNIPFELEDVFKELSGMNLREFLWTGFFVLSHCLGQPYMRIPPNKEYFDQIRGKWHGDSDNLPSPESFQKFLAMTSMSLSDFKAEIGDLRRVDPTLINVDYWPLIKFPIVKTSENEISIPIPKLLIERITTGIFFDLADHLMREGSDNSFREYFGHIFERYVGLQLESIFSKEALIPEHDYGKKGRKTPDWFINDSFMPMAFECRSSTFTRDTRINAGLEGIAKDLSRIGVQTLINVKQKVQDISDGKTDIEFNSEKEIRTGLCTWENLYPLGLFGGLLFEELENISNSENHKFHLIPLFYLEQICALQDPSLVDTSVEAMKVDRRWLDPSYEGQHTKLKQVLSESTRRNPIIEQAFNEFMSDLDTEDESA